MKPSIERIKKTQDILETMKKHLTKKEFIKNAAYILETDLNVEYLQSFQAAEQYWKLK